MNDQPDLMRPVPMPDSITSADLFAAAALLGLLALRRDLGLSDDEESRRRLAKLAWALANTMLAVGEDGRIY